MTTQKRPYHVRGFNWDNEMAAYEPMPEIKPIAEEPTEEVPTRFADIMTPSDLEAELEFEKLETSTRAFADAVYQTRQLARYARGPDLLHIMISGEHPEDKYD